MNLKSNTLSIAALITLALMSAFVHYLYLDRYIWELTTAWLLTLSILAILAKAKVQQEEIGEAPRYEPGLQEVDRMIKQLGELNVKSAAQESANIPAAPAAPEVLPEPAKPAARAIVEPAQQVAMQEPQLEPTIDDTIADYIIQATQAGSNVKTIVSELATDYPEERIYQILNYLAATGKIKPQKIKSEKKEAVIEPLKQKKKR